MSGQRNPFVGGLEKGLLRFCLCVRYFGELLGDGGFSWGPNWSKAPVKVEWSKPPVNQHKHLTTPTSNVQCLQVVLQPLSDAQPVLVSYLPGVCWSLQSQFLGLLLSLVLCSVAGSGCLSGPIYSPSSVIHNEEPQLKFLDRAAGVRLADVCKMFVSLCVIKSICCPLTSIVRIPQEGELQLLHIS